MICNKNESLLQVMKHINNNALGIVFIVDDNKKLCSTITDGDIRRALLNDVGLHETIEGIISSDFTYGKIDDSYESLLKKITDRVKIIPLVNESFEVVDFFEYKQDVYFPVAVPNLNGNEFKYLTDAFMSTWISSNGEYINRFEKEFSYYCDCNFGVSVSNGTVALHLALEVLDVKSGDEVIIPDFTFAATINAVLHANATPVIVDIEEDSWCIDPKEIEKAITPNTKAIIAVHLYGQPCNMEAIMSIAKKYNLYVIEDCAEAHGAQYDGKKVGSFGDIGCFSFYGNKVITTGEGGMCVTNNKRLDNEMRVLRDHGMSKIKRYWHDKVGYNYRLTNLQAAIGVAQLERINDIHDNRRKYENAYKEVLCDSMFQFQEELKKRTRITWLVSVVLEESNCRDELLQKLKDLGIDGRPFFYPLSHMEIYKKYSKNKNTVTEKISKAGINLPTYESLINIEDISILLKEIK